MQTNFTPDQLADPGIALSEKILRKCVHCGFCTATCPTYLTLGDELDSPRGRIYLIKDMLENDRPADAKTVKHIDRCLSCLACMTTCPSGVDYMHLVDHARTHIEKTYKRPLIDRFYRKMLAFVLPYPKRFFMALFMARLARPFSKLLSGFPVTKPLASMLELAPDSLPSKPASSNLKQSYRAENLQLKKPRGRVILMQGCAQRVLDPAINLATIQCLTRLGYEVLTPKKEGCCGALVHHMGKEDQSIENAKHNIDTWLEAKASGDLDAIIITASGCGTMVKDYAHLLRNTPQYEKKSAEISSITKDITEFLSQIELPKSTLGQGIRLAYHSACSLQHGQKITTQPKSLLEAVGFDVIDIPEGHLCCGSAGTYNILQSDIANRLKQRKINNINRTSPDLIAAGNIGCLTQIASGTDIPIAHTIEILNWAYGGALPEKLEGVKGLTKQAG